MTDNKPTKKLPILVTISHAATGVPEEVKDIVALSARDILSFSDLYTDQIYNNPKVHVVQGEVGRIFVDPNRAPDDISKEYEQAEEGVTVLTTWDGRKVYSETPSSEMVETLISKYHHTFHERIDELMPEIQFLIDGHSYLPVGPGLKKDSGKKRPDINIGNVNYSTCSREQTVFFREFFVSRGFSVKINFPYIGKYILGHHCHRRRIPSFLVPGVQIEINQALYVDEETLKPIPGKIEELQKLFDELIESFANKYLSK